MVHGDIWGPVILGEQTVALQRSSSTKEERRKVCTLLAPCRFLGYSVLFISSGFASLTCISGSLSSRTETSPLTRAERLRCCCCESAQRWLHFVAGRSALSTDSLLQMTLSTLPSLCLGGGGEGLPGQCGKPGGRDRLPSLI